MNSKQIETMNERLDEAVGKVEEGSLQTSKTFVAGMSMNSFLNFVHGVQFNDLNDKQLYDKMLNDATVSNVIGAYVSALVVRDNKSNHVCEVLSDDTKLVNELNKFLFDILDIDNHLSGIALRCLAYGCSPVELCQIDSVSDKQWSLFSESKDLKTRGDILESFKSATRESLLESLTVDKTKKLTEDVLTSFVYNKKMRWYLNLLPIWSMRILKSRGKDIAFIDVENTDRVYDGEKLVPFYNLSVTDVDTMTSLDGSDSYTVASTESFLKPAREAYQVLSSFEDLLLIHALTTAINYRIFQVDVGALDNEQTPALLQDIKKRINENEAFDMQKSFYSSSMTGVPMGASIIIPTRNGVGTITVQQIDNDFGTEKLGDFDYFKNKLASALHSNSLLTGSTDNAGGLDSGGSMSVLDERADDYIEKYRLILASNLERLCDIYLKSTRSVRAYDKLSTFTVKLHKKFDISHSKFIKLQQEAASSLKAVIESLKEAGFDMVKYKETSIELVRQFVGDTIANSLQEEMKVLEEEGISLGDGSGEGEEDLGGEDSFGGEDDFGGSSDDMSNSLEEPGIDV